MRTIEILISDPLYAKLVSIAAKASGQDKPSDQQVANTLAGLAQHSLDRAFAQVSKPEPVSKPLDIALPRSPRGNERDSLSPISDLKSPALP